MDVIKPEISVIMSVYNEPIEWLKDAIDSILNQTFENFEFIIVLDNPFNKEAEETILNYLKKDKRIKFLKNDKNLGLHYSLNKALKIANGNYIARMDADDISLEYRLEKQYKYIKENDVDLLGTWVYKMDEKGKIFGIMKTPTEQKLIKLYLESLRTAAFHPTWMVKKEVYLALNGYRPFIAAQDYDFLLRTLDLGYKISNIKEVLLKYRIHNSNTSSKKSIYQLKSALYALKLHKERINLGKDSFNEGNYLKYMKTSSFMEKLHYFSNRMFLKAMRYKDKKTLMFLYLFFSLLSPYQLKRLILLMKTKII